MAFFMGLRKEQSKDLLFKGEKVSIFQDEKNWIVVVDT